MNRPYLFYKILIFTTLLVSQTAIAQVFSPYSRYGLGTLRNPVFSANRAMGSVAAPYKNGSYINFANPASYGFIRYATIEAGANVDFNRITVGDTVYKSTNGSVNHVALAVPVNLKKGTAGISMGLLPFSNVNYSFIQRYDNDTVLGPHSYLFDGDGSNNQVYLGIGMQFKGFAFGVNGAYVFGKTEYNKVIAFPDSSDAFYTRNTTSYNIKGFTYNAGLQYNVRVFHNPDDSLSSKRDIYFTAGATVSAGVKLTTKYSNYWDRFYFNTSGGAVVVDTSNAQFNVKSKITMPYQLSGGVMLGNERFWQIGADFHYAAWSKYSAPLGNDNLSNSYRFNVGFQLIPNDFEVNKKRYFNKVQYRAGFSYGLSEVSYKGQQLNEIGGSIGLAFPFRIAVFEASRINVTGEFGSRGTNVTGSVRENYFKLTFGLSINDIWFIRRKFD